MLPEETFPQGGQAERGAHRPGQFRFNRRLETICERCGREIVFWRPAGNPTPDNAVRCNGPDKQQCGIIVAADHGSPVVSLKKQRLAEHQAQEAKAKAQKAARKAQGLTIHAANLKRKAAKSKPYTDQEDALRKRHLDRRWTCHRPQKKAHLTQDQAEGDMLSLQARYPDRADLISVYLCGCSFWHVGRRRWSEPQ